jgi:hypothetical protein
VIVTVIAVRMVQVTFDQIIDMVAMRHCLVPATRAVLMPTVVAAAVMVRRAALRVICTDFQDVVLDKRRAGRADRMMELALMEVVDVAHVFHCGVTALWTVLMIIVRMGC